MKRKEVEEALKELGFTTKSELNAEIEHIKKNKLTVYYKDNDVELYLGDNHIENVNLPYTFNYEDGDKEELSKYINTCYL
jgi:CRISPR/Cas system Type II protein with McrA/HNH and RuvC-like nuclease domain